MGHRRASQEPTHHQTENCTNKTIKGKSTKLENGDKEVEKEGEEEIHPSSLGEHTHSGRLDGDLTRRKKPYSL
jgi:hypothetical protein